MFRTEKPSKQEYEKILKITQVLKMMMFGLSLNCVDYEAQEYDNPIKIEWELGLDIEGTVWEKRERLNLTNDEVLEVWWIISNWNLGDVVQYILNDLPDDELAKMQSNFSLNTMPSLFTSGMPRYYEDKNVD